MNENDRNELLTIPEFASALRLKPSAVRRWIGERKISIVRVGRLVRISTAELDRIVSEGTRPARGTARAR
jgi:excisionase family DNA binding protein